MLALTLLAAPALGADADKAAAKAHYEAATRLYDLKEWAKALEEYKAAYLSKPDPAFLYNIGQCYRKLGRASQALEFYKEYLKKTAPDDPNRANVEARVREMEAGDVFEADVAPRSGPSPFQEPPPAKPIPAAGAPSAGPAFQPIPPEAAPPSMPAPAPLPPAPAAEPPPPSLELSTVENVGPAPTPIFKRWWFWTGIGAVVVGATVAVIAISAGGKHGSTADTALGTQAVFQ